MLPTTFTILFQIFQIHSLFVEASHGNTVVGRGDPSPLRQVVVTTKVKDSKVIAMDPPDQSMFAMHSYLEIGSSSMDGILLTHMAIDDDVEDVDPLSKGYHPRFRELRVGQPLVSRDQDQGVTVRRIVIGETRYRNKEIFDRDTGTGAAVQDWSDHNEYRIGAKFAGRIDNCQHYIQRTLINMGMTVPDELQTAIRLSDLYYGSRYSEVVECTMNTALHYRPVADASDDFTLDEKLVALDGRCLSPSAVHRRQAGCLHSSTEYRSCWSQKAWWVD